MGAGLKKKLNNAFINWLTAEPPPASDSMALHDYERLRYEVRLGDVLLFEGRSRISNVIRTVTQSSWTHAALYIGRFHDIEDRELKKIVRQHLEKRENVRLVIEAVLGKGTIVTPLSHYRGSHIRICRPTGLLPDDAQIIVNHAISALGKPYSLRKVIDLARFLLPWAILPRRWGSSLFRTSSGEIESGICSSLIAECFNEVQFPILPLIRPEEEGIRVIQRNPHLYTPRDFDYSPYFEIIKCPVMNPEEERPYYRRLPWDQKAVHNDYGSINEPHPARKSPKKFLSRFRTPKSDQPATESTKDPTYRPPNDKPEDSL